MPSGGCFPCSEITQIKFISEMDAAELPALRVRLEEALARVEIQQRVMDEVMAPRNLSEANELEGQLQSALEQVQAMRRAMEEPDEDSS